MNEKTPDFIKDADASSFERDVIQRSHTQLVLVDFWAAWCGPCRSLTPILEKLMREFSGAACLVKVNTDQERDLAAQFGIRSLPTVFLFRSGNVVDQFMGVQPESVIRRMIERHAVRESDRALDEAVSLYAAGDAEGAVELLEKAVELDPGNDRPKFQLSEWLLDSGRFERAGEILETLSGEGKNDPRYRAMSARVEFGLAAGEGEPIEALMRTVEQDGGNLEARFRLANRLVQNQQLQEALDQLIEIIRRDKSFGDDAPRRTMLKIFDLAGGHGKLVSRYRSLLAQALN